MLERGIFIAICDRAVATVSLPEDVLRTAAGLRPHEPFLIDASRLERSRHLGKRYLSILAELYRGDPGKFEQVAAKVHGTVRTYFAPTKDAVESTGQSNDAAEIPGTGWYASINNSEALRTENVRRIMTGMGFSFDYCRMVSRLCLRHTAELPTAYVRALKKYKAEPAVNS